MAGQDKAVPSLGTKVFLGNGASPESFTAIAEVKDMSIGGKTNMLDSTHLADLFKGVKPGLQEIAAPKLTCNFLVNDATQSLTQGLMLVWANKSLRNFQIQWTDGLGGVAATWQFAAYVSGWNAKGSVTSLLAGDFELTIDGEPAFI